MCSFSTGSGGIGKSSSASTSNNNFLYQLSARGWGVRDSDSLLNGCSSQGASSEESTSPTMGSLDHRVLQSVSTHSSRHWTLRLSLPCSHRSNSQYILRCANPHWKGDRRRRNVLCPPVSMLPLTPSMLFHLLHLSQSPDGTSDRTKASEWLFPAFVDTSTLATMNSNFSIPSAPLFKSRIPSLSTFEPGT